MEKESILAEDIPSNAVVPALLVKCKPGRPNLENIRMSRDRHQRGDMTPGTESKRLCRIHESLDKRDI
jgi:hypothetical protein